MRRLVDAGPVVKANDVFTKQAFNVLTSSRLLEALDLSKESPKVRERYGDGKPYKFQYDGAPTVNEQLLLARRLVEAGVRCVTLSYGRWDSHGDNFGLVRDHGTKLDQCLSALIEDLDERGLLDDVSVVAWGEFGRTPKINKSAGRDHWPQVSCALLAGGGIRAGQVIGATNRLGEAAVDRPVHFQEIIATLYQNLGIDPNSKPLFDPAGRPQRLVEMDPLPELVGVGFRRETFLRALGSSCGGRERGVAREHEQGGREPDPMGPSTAARETRGRRPDGRLDHRPGLSRRVLGDGPPLLHPVSLPGRVVLRIRALHVARRELAASLVFLVLSIAPVVFVVAVENRFRSQPTTDEAKGALRLVHWNVCRGALGVVERPFDDRVVRRRRERDLGIPDPFEGFEGLHRTGVGELQVVSKHPLRLVADYTKGRLMMIAVECALPAGTVVLLVADLPANVIYHRHPMLLDLMGVLERTRADILVGDLNAPRRSIVLSDLPEGYEHAYRSTGAGWSYTWPFFFPVLAIDHCVYGERIEPLGYRLETKTSSDHRLQVFEFRVRG